MKHILLRLLPISAGAALICAGMVAIAPAAPAQADAPPTPVGEFYSELCATDGVVDETGEDPKNAQGSGNMPDLTRVFGQRLAEYNAGGTVLLYSNTGGGGGGTPNCAVRYDEVTDGPVTEWMYCTDQTSKTCSNIDTDGFLTQNGDRVGSLEALDGNDRLTADQEKIISYIIRHDLPVLNDGFVSTVDMASNETPNSRSARQDLVWCVSDWEAYGQYIEEWCDAGIGEELQQTILAAMPDEPVLELTPATADVETGEVAEFTLTTNLANQPITVQAEGAELELCEATDGVTFENGELTITSLAEAEHEVKLCASSDTAGDVQVDTTAISYTGDKASWVQSAGTDDITCQVYASITPGAVTHVAANAQLSVTEGTGGSEDTDEPEDEDTNGDDEGTDESENEDTNEGTDEGDSEEEDQSTAGAKDSADENADSLATTGGASSAPFIAGGIALLLAGSAAVAVSAARRRQSASL